VNQRETAYASQDPAQIARNGAGCSWEGVNSAG
jgi:hypothetical protein